MCKVDPPLLSPLSPLSICVHLRSSADRLSYAENPVKAIRIVSFYSSKPSSRYPGPQPRGLDSRLFAAMPLESVPSRPRANSSVTQTGIASSGQRHSPRVLMVSLRSGNAQRDQSPGHPHRSPHPRIK